MAAQSGAPPGVQRALAQAGEQGDHLVGARVLAYGAAFGELLAEDAVVETPFAPPGHPRRVEGRREFTALAERGRAALPVRFEEVRDVVTHRTDAPETVVVEYELAGTVTHHRPSRRRVLRRGAHCARREGRAMARVPEHRRHRRGHRNAPRAPGRLRRRPGRWGEAQRRAPGAAGVRSMRPSSQTRAEKGTVR
ncbi:nuclear transport factor 2 family protein [Streptosporangium sandarakinum]|uniref:nuclear transport factor 2 family protein n=1 Tax=Streptosporangium sandarakinum TaxID=1260955 RepID=UPI003713D203